MKHLLLITATLYSALIVFLSSQPYLRLPDVGFRLSDKLLHSAEYFVFAVLWYAALRPFRISRRRVFFAAALFFAGALFAVSDEIHQSFVPNRQADLFDLAADLTGLLSGILAASILFSARSKEG